MELSQRNTIYGHFYTNKDLSDEETEKFFVELEDLMDKYRVYYVDVVMNPYKKKIKLI